jgi:hypothetical protein
MAGYDHTGESNGAEDIDEFFVKMGRCSIHLEKMSNNCYALMCDAGGKSLTINIGHWPKRNSGNGGTVKMNIVENAAGGKWHY